MHSTCACSADILVASPIGIALRLLCKYNLHQLVCRLVKQAQLRGHSSNYGELWGENFWQLVKSSTKFRTTSAPELVIIKTLLIKAAVARLTLQHPQHTKTFDELIPAYRMAGMRGRNVDSGDEAILGAEGGDAASAAAVAEGGGGGEATAEVLEDGDVQLMLGSGKQLRGEEKERFERSIKLRLTDTTIGWPTLDGWHAVWLDIAAALKHQHADQGGGGYTFKSVSYTRSLQRVSYFAVVRYIENGASAAYIARIHFFAKMPAASREAAQAAAAAARQVADAQRARDTATGEPATTRGRSHTRGSGRGRGRGRKRGRPSGFEAAETAAQGAEIAAAGAPPKALRIALCDLYKARTCSNWRGRGYFVADIAAPWKVDVSIPLDELSEKVVVASRVYDRKQQQQQQGLAMSSPAWFIPYENLSNTTAL